MKLAILGASVSAQTRDHLTGEINGYAEVIRSSLGHSLDVTEVHQFTYPGSRASDGGVVRSMEVRDYRPDVCLFEPNSEDDRRGEYVTQEEVHYIFRNIIEAGAKPVALFLPEGDVPDPTDRPPFALVNAVCAELGVPTIIVDISNEANPAGLFRDGWHTTAHGASLFGKVIVERLGDIVASGSADHVRTDKLRTSHRIQTISMDRQDGFRRLSLRIDMAPEQEPAFIRVIHPQLIGTFSPLIDVAVDGRVHQRSIWDDYCHYERDSYVVLFSGLIHKSGMVDISVSDRDPDYARCRSTGVVWPDSAERHMQSTGSLCVLSDKEIVVRLASMGW